MMVQQHLEVQVNQYILQMMVHLHLVMLTQQVCLPMVVMLTQLMESTHPISQHLVITTILRITRKQR